MDDKLLAECYRTAERFALTVLGLSLAPWQSRFLADASSANYRKVKRRRVGMLAPNGSGKDSMCIAPLALWWLLRYPKAGVVVTSADDTQLTLQTWKYLVSHKHRLPLDWRWVESPRKRIITPTGGWLLCMTTDEAGRSEGYHLEEPDGPLLMVIDEAKSVADWLFDSWDRCTYNLMLEISSGGYEEGRFYEHYSKSRSLYEWYEISWDECPYIPREKERQAIAEFGIDSPHVQSNIYGKFMSKDARLLHVIELSDIRRNQAANIPKRPGIATAGADFGAGTDLNAIVKVLGNYVPDDGIVGWPDKDTAAAKYRFIEHFNRMMLRPSQIWGDADGMGTPILCELDKVGWCLNRFHGGSKSPDPAYTNMISWAWNQLGIRIRKHEIIVPDHKRLVEELSSRRIKIALNGKLGLESKDEMRARGLLSPNYADSLAMAMCIVPFKARSYEQGSGRTSSGAWDPSSGFASHGFDAPGSNPMSWNYTIDGETGGRPGSDGQGFGGDNSDSWTW